MSFDAFVYMRPTTDESIAVGDELASAVSGVLGIDLAKVRESRYRWGGPDFDALLAENEASDEPTDIFPVRVIVRTEDRAKRIAGAYDFARRLRQAGFDVAIEDDVLGNLLLD